MSDRERAITLAGCPWASLILDDSRLEGCDFPIFKLTNVTTKDKIRLVILRYLGHKLLL
jgi:hypothetical protein